MNSWSNRAANTRATWSRVDSVPYPSPLGFQQDWMFDLGARGEAMVTYELEGRTYVVVASGNQVTALDADDVSTGSFAKSLWSANLAPVSDLVYNAAQEELLVLGGSLSSEVGTTLWVLDPRTGIQLDDKAEFGDVSLARNVTLAGDYLVQLVASPASVGGSSRSLHGFRRQAGGPCYQQAWATPLAYAEFPQDQRSTTWQDSSDWTQIASGYSPVNGSVLIAHAQADPTRFRDFLTDKRYARSRCGFLCLDSSTGTVLWRHDFDSTYQSVGNWNAGAFPGRCIPVDSQGNWYVGYQVCDYLGSNQADSVLESFTAQGVSRWKQTRSHHPVDAGNWINNQTVHIQLGLVGDDYLITRGGGAFSQEDFFERGVVCRRTSDGSPNWAIAAPLAQNYTFTFPQSNMGGTADWLIISADRSGQTPATYRLVDAASGAVVSLFQPESERATSPIIDGKGRAYVFDVPTSTLRRLGRVSVSENRDALRSCCPPYDTVCLSGFCTLNFGELTYHGAFFENVPSSMGFGWKSPYEARLVETEEHLTLYDGSGNFERWVPAGGNAYAPAHEDNYVRAVKNPGVGWTLTSRGSTRMHFDVAGRLQEVLDRNENRAVYEYEEFGAPPQLRLARVRDDFGRSVTLGYRPDGQFDTITAAPGNRVSRYEYHPDGRLKAMVNPELERMEFAYYPDGRLWKVFDPPNASPDGNPAGQKTPAVVYTYYPANHLQAGKVWTETFHGLRSNTYTYGVDGEGLSTLTVQARDLTAQEGDPDPVSPPVHNQVFRFDGKYRLRTSVDPRGNETHLAYDLVNPYLVASVTDPNGTTRYRYNAESNLRETEDVQGNVTRFTYFGEENAVTPEDPRYYQLSRVERPKVTVPLHDIGTDLAHQGPQETYAPSRFLYDTRGNLVGAGDALGHQTFLFRRVPGPPPATVPALDSDVYWQPDEPTDGRVKAIMDRNGHLTRFTYLPNGNLETVTTPETRGSDRNHRLTTTFSYSGFNFDQLESVLEPSDGASDPTVWRYQLDNLDRLRNLTDPRGFATSFHYEKGLLRSVNLPANQRACETPTPEGYFRSDPSLGNATSPTRATAFEYDAASRLERVVSFLQESAPTQMRVRYGYDGFGRLARMFRLKDGDEVKKAEYRYDLLGRPSAVLHPSPSESNQGNWHPSTGKRSLIQHDAFCNGFDSQSARGVKTRVDYDNLCRPSQLTNGSGTTQYVHDELGRLIKTIQPGGPQASRYGSAVFARNKYGEADTAPEVKTFSYDALDRLVEMTFPDGNTIQYDYYPEGQLKSVVDVHLKKTEYAYYDDGRLRTVTHDGKHVFEYQYDGRGRLQTIVYPKSTRIRASFAWNAAHLLKEISYQQSDGATSWNLHRMSYEYDASGNRNRFVDTPLNINEAITWDYWYDGFSRLEWVYKDGKPFSRYAFDESDNRVAFKRVDQVTEYQLDPGRDELLYTISQGTREQDFFHDLDGNMTGRYHRVTQERHTYTLNGLNRIIKIDVDKAGGVSESWLHSYDASNLRKSKQSTGGDGARIDYYYSGLPMLSQRTTSGPDTRSVSYIVGHQVLGYIVRDELYCFVTDALGSIRSILAENGDTVTSYTYDEYGQSLSIENGVASPGFIGGTGTNFDPITRQVEMLFRNYDPETGRFTSRDPLGVVGGINLYSYAKCNPLSQRDSSGLVTDEDLIHQAEWRAASESEGEISIEPWHVEFMMRWTEAGMGIIMMGEGVALGLGGGAVAATGVGVLPGGAAVVAGGAIAAAGAYATYDGIMGISQVFMSSNCGGSGGPSGPGGSFRQRGPEARGFDWDHIIRRHAEPRFGGNPIFADSTRDIFWGLNRNQIVQRVTNAWRNRVKISGRQYDPTTGHFRQQYRGVDSTSGRSVEFWMNLTTKIVETAYPGF